MATTWKTLMMVCFSVLLGEITTASAQPVSQPDCSRVCSEIRAKVKSNSRKVTSEYELWQQRLGVKADVIRYPQGMSAAEELLRFMSTYYVTKAPANQMEPSFLAYTMGKCFPEAYIDPDRARLHGLVDTIWVAQNLRVERELTTCLDSTAVNPARVAGNKP